MKYILSSDMCILLKKRKVIILYIVCLMFCCVFGKFIADGINLSFHTLGLEVSGSPFALIMYMLNILFYAYFTSYLFINDVKNNSENVLSRLSKRKYVLYKIVSVVIITFVLKAIAYIFVYALLKEKIEFIIFLKDYLFTLIIDLFFVFILIVSKYSIISVVILIITLIFCFCFPRILLPINNNLCYLIPIFITVIILNILISKILFDFYERVK